MFVLISVAALLFFVLADQTEDVLLNMAEEMGCQLETRDFLVVFGPDNIPAPETNPIDVVKSAFIEELTFVDAVARDSAINDVWLVQGSDDVQKSFELITSFASGHNMDAVKAGAVKLAKNTDRLILAVRKVGGRRAQWCQDGGIEFTLFDFDQESVHVMVPAACDEALDAARESQKRDLDNVLKR